MFITVKQASEKWGISDRRIRTLCSNGKIPLNQKIEDINQKRVFLCK